MSCVAWNKSLPLSEFTHLKSGSDRSHPAGLPEKIQAGAGQDYPPETSPPFCPGFSCHSLSRPLVLVAVLHQDTFILCA